MLNFNTTGFGKDLVTLWDAASPTSHSPLWASRILFEVHKAPCHSESPTQISDSGIKTPGTFPQMLPLHVVGEHIHRYMLPWLRVPCRAVCPAI